MLVTMGTNAMGRRPGGRGAGMVGLLAMTAMATLFAANPALAQGQKPPGRQQVAQAAQVRAFDIPVQPLGSALTAFGQQSGLQVTFDAVVASGVRSAPVAGTLAPEDALRRLLSGTGVTYSFIDARTVTVQKVPAASGGATTLSPVTVEADRLRETAWGPAPGYVATRSAAGTKTDTPLIETPAQISVVTRDEMDAIGAQSLQQSLRYTAGITPETRSTLGGYDMLYGRGFFLDKYLDGMKLSNNNGFASPQTELYGLERVEFIHGPASVLYGQASPGGIVNQISKRPTATPFGEVSLMGGSYSRIQGAFDIGGPLDKEGKYLYRLTGLAKQSDTQVNYTREKRLFIAPSFTWRPTNDTSLTFLTHYKDDPDLGLYNFVPAQGSVLGNPNGKISTSFYAGDPSFNDLSRKQYSLGYAFEHRFDDMWTVRQNLRYLHTDGTFKQVLPLSLAANGRTLNRYVQVDLETVGAFTIDNQVQAKFDTGPLRHTVLAGLDYQNTADKDRIGQALGPSIDIFNPVYNQTIVAPGINTTNMYQTLNQTGVYLQDQIKFDRVSLLFAGREDWVDNKTRNRLNNTTTTLSDSAFTGRVGALYLFDFGLAPYVAYTSSFQPTSGAAYGGAAFKPTKGKQIEGGVKYQPTGFNSFVTATAFNMTQQDVLTPDPAHTGFSVQTGEIRSRGIELEGQASLTDGLNLTASYSYLDSEVTKSNTTNLGKTPLYTPSNMASAWLDYTIPSGPARGLGIGGGARYVGATWGNSTNTLRIPGFTLFDASIHYDLGGLNNALQGTKLTVNASNLFDKTYVSECTNTVNCLYGYRRTIYATVSYRW